MLAPNGEDDDVGTCAVCLQAFSAESSDSNHLPRLLKCGHSFCTACLVALARPAPPGGVAQTEAEAEAQQGMCQCPKCRMDTLLVGHGATGVQGLPRNFDLIDLLSHHHQRRPRAAVVRPCGGCGQQAASQYCEACGGVHLCASCDTQLHALLMNRSHVRVASADAAEPRAACQHHSGKKVEMWCERDGAAVCVVCLVVGPHKGHDAVTIEEDEARGREAVRAELARVEAAIGEVDATMARATVRAADELKSAAEARAAVKRHFDQMREAVAQRELALGVEIDEWTRARAEAAAKQLDELDEVKRRLAAAGKAIQRQQPGGGSISWAVAAGEEVCLAATTAVKATDVGVNSIAFSSGAIQVQDVKSSGRLVKERSTTSFPSFHLSAAQPLFGGTSLFGAAPSFSFGFGQPSTAASDFFGATPTPFSAATATSVFGAAPPPASAPSPFFFGAAP